jgi:hypothetical protein
VVVLLLPFFHFPNFIFLYYLIHCVLADLTLVAGALPHVKGWIETELGIDAKIVAPSGPIPKGLPPPLENPALLEALKGHCLRYSLDNMDRLHHSHGHTAMVHMRGC